MIVIERGTQTHQKPAREAVPPGKQQVVLHQPVNRNIPCTVCLLKVVFHMTDEVAVRHANRARNTGADPVYMSLPEIAETKATIANQIAQDKGKTCHPRAKQIFFTTECAP